MAPARRPRSSDDTDTESELEQETPRKSKLRKRLSEIHRPGDDDGTTEGRVPLRSVNINDDAAEKRRRRKSTKLHIIESALAAPLDEGGAPAQDAQTGEQSKASKQKQQLNAIAPPILNVQLDINNAKFEEWMKLATDNVGFLLLSYRNRTLNHSLPENQRAEFMELCSHRLLS